jgi:phosphate:Na+ symporter
MTPTLILINIIAGVCLLLWGVKLVRLGITYGFGSNLRAALAASTQSRIKSFFSGLFITTLLQSSTATIMIISAFAGQGMIKAGAGLAMVLGADVGTTLVAQIFSFDISFLIPLLMIAGFILFNRKKSGISKNIGRVFVGIALMLLALGWIKEAAGPLKTSELLSETLAALQTDPLFAVLLAALMTWLAHSSLAIVLLIMSFVATGILPVILGFYMVLGANLGGTIPPILATLKDHEEARRIPFGNLFMRLIGVFIAFVGLVFFANQIDFLGDNPERQIVNFHTAFNVALALLFLPLTGIMNKICENIIPDNIERESESKARYLNDKDISTPTVALAAATRETLRMADLVQQMLDDTIHVLKGNNRALLKKVRQEDDTIDHLYSQIKIYMAKLSQEFMSEKEAERYVQVLTFATNLEHAGDVIDKNIMPLAEKKMKRQIEFSDEGFNEIQNIHALVLESIQLAQSIFVSMDSNMAKQLLKDKRDIKNAETQAMENHIERLSEGVPETINSSSLHIDLIRDYRRINSYVSTIAYPLIEEEKKND